jgi:hypothetical protein
MKKLILQSRFNNIPVKTLLIIYENMSNKYGEYTKAINRGIKNGDAGELRNNQAVRNYAYDTYKEMGLNTSQAQARMDQKDAGHIQSRNHGGQNIASNYMWEDRHDNRAHGDATIAKSELKRGGRW